MKQKIFSDRFLYGTQFYRPPNPPIKERKRDLENIKNLGFNIIKIFAEWNWINNFENKNDFEELIYIIKEAQKLEIIIDINIRLEQAPFWVAEKYPDSFYMDSRDRKIELQARSNTPTGGWPGLCFDHPGAKMEAEKFLISCAKTFDKYENVAIFDCWNEPHIEAADPTGSVGIGDFLFCYCPNTIRSYQDYLKNEYQDITKINELWIKRYRSFQDIRPPRKLLDYVEMTEWRKFMTYSMAEKMNWRYKTLKENLSAKKIVMSHSVSHGITSGFSIYGCDDYQLTEKLDMFGLSLFPIWANSDAFDVCLDIEVTRNMSRGKICINTELQGGAAICAPTGFSRSRIPQRNHYRMWNFLDVAFGLKGIMYWHYRAEMLGHEAPGFGLVNRDGSFTDRSDETSKICSFLNKYHKFFNNIQSAKPDVAILVNRDSYYLNFAAEGNEKYSTESLRGLHRFLTKNNVPAAILIDNQVEEDFKDYKIIYLQSPFVMSESMASRIKKYVREGGVIVSDCAAGIFDKFGVSQEVIPSFGLDEVFGVKQAALRQFDSENREDVVADFWPEHHYVEKREPVYFEGKGILEDERLKMSYFLETYTLDKAEAILMYEGQTTGIYNRFGEGNTYLLGSLTGIALLHNDSFTESLLKKILISEGIEFNCKNDLIIKRFYSKELDTGAVFIINPGRKTVKETIDLDSRYKIKEFYNKPEVFKHELNKITFEIPGEDACCIIY